MHRLGALEGGGSPPPLPMRPFPLPKIPQGAWGGFTFPAAPQAVRAGRLACAVAHHACYPPCASGAMLLRPSLVDVCAVQPTECVRMESLGTGVPPVYIPPRVLAVERTTWTPPGRGSLPRSPPHKRRNGAVGAQGSPPNTHPKCGSAVDGHVVAPCSRSSSSVITALDDSPPPPRPPGLWRHILPGPPPPEPSRLRICCGALFFRVGRHFLGQYVNMRTVEGGWRGKGGGSAMVLAPPPPPGQRHG